MEDSFTISYSVEDVQWVATHSTYKYISWLDDDPREALKGLILVIKNIKEEVKK